MTESREYPSEFGDIVLSHRCVDYLNMSPETPVGDLSDPGWRMRSTREFIEYCREDVQDADGPQPSSWELSAAASAVLDYAYATAKNATGPALARHLKPARRQANGFLGKVMTRAESDPVGLDDPQFYLASCLRAADRFIQPYSGKAFGHTVNRARGETLRKLVQLNQHITATATERESEKQESEVGRLYVVRAELLTAAALMRKDRDRQPLEETSLVLPALTRQAYSLARTPVDQKWSNSVWRRNSEAALETGISFATPPDAKLLVKQVGAGDRRARDPSVAYVSLLDDIVHTEDEEHIGKIVESLFTELTTSREALPSEERDELDFVTRNARAMAGLDE
jgi:hypothetical protein